MQSAGNDIVDLQLIDVDRTNQSRFFSKILSLTEQAEAPVNLPFEHYVWMLWTVKESAYKYFKRLIPELVFSPAKINISRLSPPTTVLQTNTGQLCETGINATNCFTGIAESGAGTVFFRSIITPQFIATIVNNEAGFANVYWGIRQTQLLNANQQSIAVRELAGPSIQAVLGCNDLYFEKSKAGYPVLFCNRQPTGVPVSFAHHGCFVSYSFKAVGGVQWQNKCIP